MAKKKTYKQITDDLRGFVEEHCPGIEVGVRRSARWKRMCLTFRWHGFDHLLPEERFRLIARYIPPDYFEEVLQNSVWFELGGKQTMEEYMKEPRSEDIDDQIPQILGDLRKIEFFSRLQAELGKEPQRSCPDDLSISKRLLAEADLEREEVRNACLAFMRHEAYCDCEVLEKIASSAQ